MKCPLCFLEFHGFSLPNEDYSLLPLCVAKWILGLTITGAFFFGAFKWYESQQGREFPVIRSISDQAGRSIEVEILGWNGDQVQFRRLIDNRVFIVPISNLSTEDQEFLALFPESSESFETELDASETELDASETYARNMRLKIMALHEENQILRQKASDPSGYFDGRDVAEFKKRINENLSTINHIEVKISELERKHR